MEHTIRNLSIHQYHNGEKESKYLSSTQLKWYLVSPKYAKYKIDNLEEDKSDSFQFGELFHDLMACCASRYDNGTEAIATWMSHIAVFEPPVNDKTGKPYGCSTNAYKDEYEAFLRNNADKLISDRETLAKIDCMLKSLLCDSLTARKVKTMLSQSKEIETSYFYETEDGIKLKVRPDMLTNRRLVDWKTTSLEDLSEDSIAKAIIKYGYHISLSMYQYVLNKITGKWYEPILVFVQKNEPYDAVVVDLTEWCYNYDSDNDIVTMGVGAIEFIRLLRLHAECMENGVWKGAECMIPAACKGVMSPKVPAWYDFKVNE